MKLIRNLLDISRLNMEMHTVAIDIEALLCSTHVKINKVTMQKVITKHVEVSWREYFLALKRDFIGIDCPLCCYVKVEIPKSSFGPFKFMLAGLEREIGVH